MAYAFRRSGRGDYITITLVEEVPQVVPESTTYQPTSAQQAHQWVKGGGQHETALWVDDTGRIRRARG